MSEPTRTYPEFNKPRMLTALFALMAGMGILYQGTVLWQVASTMIAVGNLPMQIGFTGVFVALLGFVAWLIHEEYLSLLEWNRWSGSAFAVFTVIVGVICSIEIARINIAWNGNSLADQTATKHEAALAPAMSALENTFKDESQLAKLKDLQDLVDGCDSSIEVEQRGGKRPDLEVKLKQHGINFSFTGKSGRFGGTAALASICQQKHGELDRLLKQTKIKVGKDLPDGAEQDKITLKLVRTRITEMRSLNLTIEGDYAKLLVLVQKNRQDIRELLNKHGLSNVEFNVPAVESIFQVGLSGSKSYSLWLTALSTALGPDLILLFVSAAIGLYLRRRHDEAHRKQEDEARNGREAVQRRIAAAEQAKNAADATVRDLQAIIERLRRENKQVVDELETRAYSAEAAEREALGQLQRARAEAEALRMPSPTEVAAIASAAKANSQAMGLVGEPTTSQTAPAAGVVAVKATRTRRHATNPRRPADKPRKVTSRRS